jgi:sulfite dehydrogenase (quinone) subunit SoeA
VRIRPAEADEPEETFPTFAAMPALPGTKAKRPAWIAYFAGGRPPR